MILLYMRWMGALGIALGWLATAAARTNAPAGARLALELAEEGQYAEAALEYRRLALAASDPAERGGWFWAAACASLRAGQWQPAPALLDRAEDADSRLKPPALLLRAEAAAAGRDHAEAAYYLQSALAESRDLDFRTYAVRRAAGEQVRAGRLAEARQLLEGASEPEPERLAVLADYARGRDKRPVVGGLLGLVPGLGYAYSGEYANGLRCLILNGLFMGAMAYSAAEDQWGAFAVISFFEITWYSGSVYGGIDAAHRRNRDRRGRCIEAVEGSAAYAPDWRRLPIVSLTFRF